jgi:hypothetical protein
MTAPKVRRPAALLLVLLEASMKITFNTGRERKLERTHHRSVFLRG